MLFVSNVGQIVLDGCTYNSGIYQTLDLIAMNNLVSDYKVSQEFRVEPRRYVLPIDPSLHVSNVVVVF